MGKVERQQVNVTSRQPLRVYPTPILYINVLHLTLRPSDRSNDSISANQIAKQYRKIQASFIIQDICVNAYYSDITLESSS